MTKKTIVYSGTPGVGKSTYIQRNGIVINVQKEFPEDEEMFKKFEPYLISHSALIYEAQRDLTEYDLKNALELINIESHMDRSFLDGLILGWMQFVYYGKNKDANKLMAFMVELLTRTEVKELCNRLHYVIFITDWETNKRLLTTRNRDSDQELDWYEFSCNNYVLYAHRVLSMFHVTYELQEIKYVGLK